MKCKMCNKIAGLGSEYCWRCELLREVPEEAF